MTDELPRRLDCGCGQPNCTNGAGTRYLYEAESAVTAAIGYVGDAEDNYAGYRIDDAIAALCKARQYVGYPPGDECCACGQKMQAP